MTKAQKFAREYHSKERVAWIQSLRSVASGRWAKNADRVVWAVHTCWWYIGTPPYVIGEHKLPCDPRGSMLMEHNKPTEFIAHAEASPANYGEFGLLAFAAAYHSNVIVRATGKPTSFNSWAHYNALLKAAGCVA